MKKIIIFIFSLSLVFITGCTNETGKTEVVQVIKDTATIQNIVESTAVSSDIEEEVSSSIDVDTGITMDSSDGSSTSSVEMIETEIFMYTDGIYEGSISVPEFSSEEKEEYIELIMTISDDKIFALEFISQNEQIKNDAEINNFTAGVMALLIGQKLNEVEKYSNINGSTALPYRLTEALNKIKEDAIKKVEIIEIEDSNSST